MKNLVMADGWTLEWNEEGNELEMQLGASYCII